MPWFDILPARFVDLCFITTQYVVDHLFSLLGWLASFFAGYWTAKHLQDRETKDRQRGIALALKEEVERIRAETGGPLPANPDEIVIAGVVPEVHPWVQGIIAEAARTDPAIVAAFMRLERQLYNLRFTRRRYDEDIEALASARERHDRLIAEAKNDEENVAEELGDQLEARRMIGVSEGNLRSARGFVVVSLRLVHGVLNNLEELLTKAAR